MAQIQCQRRRGLHTVHQVYVFNSFAKASSDRALLQTTSGKPFQARGTAAAKERSPKDVFILTTSSILRPALRVPERRLYIPAQQQSVMRYSGALVHQHRHFVLYTLPDWQPVEDLQHRSDMIGASCTSHQTDSGILHTDCNRFICWSATPNNSELQ